MYTILIAIFKTKNRITNTKWHTELSVWLMNVRGSYSNQNWMKWNPTWKSKSQVSVEQPSLWKCRQAEGFRDEWNQRHQPLQNCFCSCFSLHVGFLLSHGRPALLRSEKTWLLTMHKLNITEFPLLQRCYLWAKPNPRERLNWSNWVSHCQSRVLYKQGGNHWLTDSTEKNLYQEESGKIRQALI